MEEIKATKNYNDYPVKTKYPSKRGGYWTKIGDRHFCWGDDKMSLCSLNLDDWNGNVVLYENPAFIQPCYIHKNTLELRNKLEELGYKLNEVMYCETDELLCVDMDEYSSAREYETEDLLRCQYIDCGENEDLFLALAALREDSDYKQYFVNDEDRYLIPRLRIYILKGDFSYSLMDDWYDMSINKDHKASVKEIIDYFNKEDN